MDQETIRILISGLLTASAGLGGALAAVWFNRKSTKETIRATVETAEAARKHEKSLEHARWLRDRKLAAYTAFVRHIGMMTDELDKAQRGGYPDPELLTAAGGAAFDNEILLLAPSPISQKVLRVTTAAETARRTAGNTHTEQGLAKYNEAKATMTKSFTEVRLLMRADLQNDFGLDGMPTPTTEIARSEN